MSATAVEENEVFFRPGMVESSEIQGSDLKQHIMPFESDDSEHNFHVRLHIISGSADL